ncbi:unnamed protein product [Prorocentrum cordatum]|uniref:Uncharacterized protein n=1 Tax=Prorocentrum cordatum TaxID=2364126 RepID=A0ABN9WEE4_9DINO|nr:unnamed protein product [Polarella glacialis]
MWPVNIRACCQNMCSCSSALSQEPGGPECRTGDKLASPQTVPPNFAPEEGELLLDRPTWPPGPPQLQGGAAASLEALGGVGGEGGRPSTATWPLSVALAASAAAAACPADGAAAAVRQQGAHRGIAPLKLFDALNLQTPPCAAPTSVAPSAQALAMPQNPLQAAPQAAAVFQALQLGGMPGQPQLPLGALQGTPASAGLPMWPCQVGTPTAATPTGPCGALQAPFGCTAPLQPEAQGQAVAWPFGCGTIHQAPGVVGNGAIQGCGSCGPF